MRRCNYTNRKRIDKQDVRITGAPSEGGIQFTGSLSVENAEDYPDGARVYLYVKQAPIRDSVHVGKVESEVLIKADVPGLSELKGTTIDVRIIDDDDPSRKVLALCRGHRVYSGEGEKEEENKRGLLGTRRGNFSVPLWKLNTDELDSTGAWLEISTSIVDYKFFARRREFETLVVPNVVGQIAERILVRDEYKDDPDSGKEHRDDWVRWFFSLPGMGAFQADADKDTRQEWVDEIVEAFSNDCELPRLAAEYIDEEGA